MGEPFTGSHSDSPESSNSVVPSEYRQFQKKYQMGLKLLHKENWELANPTNGKLQWGVGVGRFHRKWKVHCSNLKSTAMTLTLFRAYEPAATHIFILKQGKQQHEFSSTARTMEGHLKTGSVPFLKETGRWHWTVVITWVANVRGFKFDTRLGSTARPIFKNKNNGKVPSLKVAQTKIYNKQT